MSDSALCKVSSSEFAKVLGCQAIDFSVLCPSTLFETQTDRANRGQDDTVYLGCEVHATDRASETAEFTVSTLFLLV